MGKQLASPLLSLAIASFGLIQTPVAIAQVAPSSCVDGVPLPGCQSWVGRRSLTVIGQAQVTAPADAALLEFRFATRDQPASDPFASGLSLQTARRFTEDALKPAIDALRTAGIPARNITLQTSSVQNPRLFVRVDKPTQERLQQLVLTVEQSLKTSQTVFVQSIGAVYTVNQCEPLERNARRIALRDAQRQLLTLAEDVKVELGELLSVTVLPLGGSSSTAACGTKVGVPVSPIPFATDEPSTPYNPADQPEVQVRSQVSVTHGIKTDK